MSGSKLACCKSSRSASLHTCNLSSGHSTLNQGSVHQPQPVETVHPQRPTSLYRCHKPSQYSSLRSCAPTSAIAPHFLRIQIRPCPCSTMPQSLTVMAASLRVLLRGCTVSVVQLLSARLGIAKLFISARVGLIIDQFWFLPAVSHQFTSLFQLTCAL